MKERPILFSGPMVRAILDGRKRMTRRAVKPHVSADTVRFDYYSADSQWREMFVADNLGNLYPKSWSHKCPYGVPGDRLWVRETFFHGDGFYDDNPSVAWKNWHGLKDGKRKATWIDYKADMTDERWREFNDDPWNWNPSIFMPRWASRITLEVTGVRVERLQEITEDDARAEGVVDDGKPGMIYPNGAPPVVNAFWRLWNSLNESRGYGLDKNPWVWVVEFKTVDKTP